MPGTIFLHLALRLTAQLSESEVRCRAAIEGPGDGLFDWDVPSGMGFYSSRWKVGRFRRNRRDILPVSPCVWYKQPA